MEVRNLMLYLTNNCNLNCPYCFVNKDKRDMDFEVAKNSVDFLIDQAKKSKNLSLNFFGGEPLLKFNLIKKIVKYSKEQVKKSDKKITFGITTNGTLFTKKIVDYFWENDIGVLFSWDGDKKQIIRIKGEKAYNRMEKSFKLLTNKGYKLHARVTVPPYDLRLVDFAKSIFGMGFNGLSFLPISGTDEWEKKDTERAMMELADYYIKQARKNNILELSYFTKGLLMNLGLREPSGGPCGAGKNLMGITVDGKILPCQHPESWEENYTLGNVFDKKIDEETRKIFSEIKKGDFIGCDGCIARSNCIGICPSVNYNMHGNMLKPWKGGCIWVVARYKAIKHIFHELYVKEKNLAFIKWVLKSRSPWGIDKKETVLDLDKLEHYKNLEDLELISFKLREEDLNHKTGQKIIEFLERLKKSNDNFKINKPLPSCLFSNYSEMVRKFKIADQKGIKNSNFIPKEVKRDSCDTDGKSKVKNRKLREIYHHYIQGLEIPEKCKTCIHRIRGNCNYFYFGLEN